MTTAVTRRGAPTRRDRILVLLTTLNDIRHPEQTDTIAHTAPASKALLHSDLYWAGSYADLERCLHQLRERAPRIHWHVHRVYIDRNPVTDLGRRLSPRKANLGITYLEKHMPRFVMVPTDLLENEGFVVSTAARKKIAA